MQKEMHVSIVTDREHDEMLKKEIEGLSLESIRFKAECTLFEKCLDSVIDNKPNVVLIKSEEEYEQVLSIVKKIMKVFPTTNVLLVTNQKDPDFIVKAFRLGVKDILEDPLDLEAFKRSIGRIINEAIFEISGAKEGRVVSLYSNKGGVGVTTIAVNLAVGLAKKYPDKKIVLCDLVLEHGDIPIFMRKTADNYSVVDFISDMNRLDSKLIENSLTRDEESGLYMLLGPANPEDSDYISSEQLKTILALLKKTFDIVVLDLSHDFSDKNIVVMDESELIFLIMVLDLPSIKNVARCLEIFKKLRYQRSKVRLVVNRSNSKDQIEMNLVADKLEYPVSFSLSNDYKNVVNSINSGVPIAYNKKSCQFSKEIYRLVETIYETLFNTR
ncbi:CpaE family protein [Candidatus Omnitrophota bacterium]